ncbi:DUF885 family protein [Sphingoaurantiacus capsulatus]|uniref:DUF885 family protein n=1 Tax=Sphingoaurantiacus capsulatus TaxID=1771310 RepID=A0ABV7XC36_9SPHN
MKRLVRLVQTAAVGAILLATNPALAAQPALEAVFKDFRAIVPPKRVKGVPDYTDAAMAAQLAALKPLMAKLAAIDDNQWPVEDRVDYMIVLAEMRGLDFQHRVHRQWKRDPAFYSPTNLGFGPKIDGAFSIPKLPLDRKKAKELADNLAAVPGIYAQARTNLTEVRGDLARLGITQKNIEINVYDRLAADTARSNPDVSRRAATARDATVLFRDWLVQVAPTAPAHGGIGREDYDWYLKHVLLFPYNWEEMRVIGEREYERSMVFLKLEEHKHRGTAMIEPAETLAEFERRRNVADLKLLDFFKKNDIMTVPDWLQPVVGEGPYILPGDRDPKKPGAFDPPVQRHFFRQTEDRDPMPLRAHNLPGHLFDSIMRDRDQRPIRGADRLFFISGTRVEGWAFYLEEMIQQIGVMDDSPKGREINYILQAKRAARVLPELKLHSNEWTYDEALKSLTSRTPYWMGPDDAIGRFDLELYLRQPGYGIGYHIGKVQFEALMADVAQKEGRNFDLKRFHDRFHSYGVIPISLIRWEMTGKDDQVKTMR